jgi:hypothetical protein
MVLTSIFKIIGDILMYNFHIATWMSDESLMMAK